MLALFATIGLGGVVTAWSRDWWESPPVTAWPASLGALLLFLVSAIWHEMGHAAALARRGYPPGRMGLGVMVVIPVLFVDVTAIGLLPPPRRISVNAAGVCFQAGLGGMYVFMGESAGGGWFRDAGQLAAGSVLAAILWSLWPFIRSDGYWLAADLLGVPGLDRPLSSRTTRVARLGVLAHRIANLIFIVAIATVIPGALGTRLVGAGPPGIAIAVLVTGLVWWGAVVRTMRLAATIRRDFLVRPKSPPACPPPR